MPTVCSERAKARVTKKKPAGNKSARLSVLGLERKASPTKGKVTHIQQSHRIIVLISQDAIFVIGSTALEQ